MLEMQCGGGCGGGGGGRGQVQVRENGKEERRSEKGKHALVAAEL